MKKKKNVVYRRSSASRKFPFLLLFLRLLLFHCSWWCKIEKISLDQSLQRSPSSFILRWMDGTKIEGLFFFFFFFFRHKNRYMLLVKITIRVYSNERRILRQDTDLESQESHRREQSIRRFFFSIISSSFFPRCRSPWPSYSDSEARLFLPRLFLSYVSISFRTSGKPTNRVTLI